MKQKVVNAKKEIKKLQGKDYGWVGLIAFVAIIALAPTFLKTSEEAGGKTAEAVKTVVATPSPAPAPAPAPVQTKVKPTPVPAQPKVEKEKPNTEDYTVKSESGATVNVKTDIHASGNSTVTVTNNINVD